MRVCDFFVRFYLTPNNDLTTVFFSVLRGVGAGGRVGGCMGEMKCCQTHTHHSHLLFLENPHNTSAPSPTPQPPSLLPPKSVFRAG